MAGQDFLVQGLGDIAKDISVQVAILDRFGVIVAVNEQWKRAADASGLTLPEYGIGENYLRHCAFADPSSPPLIRGLSQVMSGEMDRLSLVYSGDHESSSRKTWFLLLAYQHPDGHDRIVVMHIDITVLVSILRTYRRDPSIDDPGSDYPTVATALSDEQAASSAGRTFLSLVHQAGRQEHSARRHSQPNEIKDPRTQLLSKRQVEVLALMAKGMTNAEIAGELCLSLNTVKVYASGILARLGLQSRAQVLHWALTRRTDDADI